MFQCTICSTIYSMKIRELEKKLLKAGFNRFRGKGSHRKYYKNQRRVVISGKPGEDAKPYQIKLVEEAIHEK